MISSVTSPFRYVWNLPSLVQRKSESVQRSGQGRVGLLDNRTETWSYPPLSVLKVSSRKGQC